MADYDSKVGAFFAHQLLVLLDVPAFVHVSLILAHGESGCLFERRSSATGLADHIAQTGSAMQLWHELAQDMCRGSCWTITLVVSRYTASTGGYRCERHAGLP